MVLMTPDPFTLAEPSASIGSVLPAADTVADLHVLRRMVAGLEAAACLNAGMAARFRPVGGAELSLRCGALHEVAAQEAGDGAAALAFALALGWMASGAVPAGAGAARAPAQARPVLLVLEAQGCREAGEPYGHGLAALGFDPGRLLIVRAQRPGEALWAFEEGLRCAALGAVVAAFGRCPRGYDLTASRRLVLAARASGVSGCLAVIGEGGAAGRLAGAAETRWRIAARPSRAGLAGEPTGLALRADLLRRRGGLPSQFDLEWNHDTGQFIPPGAGQAPGREGRPPLSVPLAAASAGRPVEAA
jgi:protein ImuA